MVRNQPPTEQQVVSNQQAGTAVTVPQQIVGKVHGANIGPEKVQVKKEPVEAEVIELSSDDEQNCDENKKGEEEEENLDPFGDAGKLTQRDPDLDRFGM